MKTIPSVKAVPDAQVRKVLEAMKEAIEQLQGRTGDALAWPVTRGELKEAGVVGIDGRGALYDPDAAAAEAFDATDFDSPPAPTNLAARVAYNTVLLTWTKPAFRHQLWTEVWELAARAFSTAVDYAVGDFVLYGGTVYKCTTAHAAGAWNAANFTAAVAGDYVAANARLVAVSPASAHVHAIDIGATSYFWIRTVTAARVASAFGAIAGVTATAVTLSGLAPIGSEIPAQASPGSEWLELAGQTLARLSYAELWTWVNNNGLATGATSGNYGPGDGATTFTLPDYRGRVPVAKAAAGTFAAVGAIGGAETVTLTTNEIPAHAHGVTDGGHAHGYDDADTTYALNKTTAEVQSGTGTTVVTDASLTPGGGDTGRTSGSATTGISTQNAGSGAAHDNLQPYVVTRWWVRVR